MKKQLAIFIILIFIFTVFPITTLGAPSATFHSRTHNIRIEGQLPPEEYQNINEVTILYSNNNNEIGHIGQTKIDQNGFYTYKFKFNGDLGGYSLNVRAGDNLNASETIISTVAEEKYVLDIKLENLLGGEAISTSNKIKGTVKIDNLYGDDTRYNIITAAYDENEKLIETQNLKEGYIEYCKNGEVLANEFELEFPATTKNAKAFLWNSMANIIPIGAKKEVSKQTYGIDNLTNENGDLVIAFLGGSITEGSNSSNNKTKAYAPLVVEKYFKTNYPKRNIQIVNAGIGGTPSTLGLFRLNKDVISKNPDVVFVEFAVNDSTIGRTAARQSMENIVRQLTKLPKQPAIIFLYSLQSDDVSQGGVWHKEVDEYYNIGSIDFHSYMKSLFGTGEFPTWATYMTDDVHPNDAGHEKYANYITQCLTENPNQYFKKHSDAVALNFGKQAKAIKLIPHSSEMITYSDGWETIPADNTTLYSYPRFEQGVKRAVGEGKSFSLNFTGTSFGVYFNGYLNGNTATYNIDNGKYTGTINTYNSYQTVGCPSQFQITDLEDGVHTVTITTNVPQGTKNDFRFGYIAVDE